MTDDIRPEGAVRVAKKWLAEVYADEQIERIALEEVRWKDGNWEITLGFTRPDFDLITADPAAQSLVDLAWRRKRYYKVLVIAGNDNHVMEMRDREVA